MIIPSILSAFESDMQAMGMKLTAKDIFDVNNASIKDAIIHFGGGCTAEIVSKRGLILTNHHCGLSQINSHSTLENNILKFGFWAKDLSEELPNQGLTATRMVNIKDVTESVLAGTENLNSQEAYQKIQTNIALIKAEALKGTHFEADIKPFDYGNSYYLLVKETFRDVRLVGNPPETIGKFGGDTDNWVWPRHTGDFSIFRIYANKDNKPADFSEENIPYTPLHHLPISMKTKKEGDFTMVFGFPGRTDQHTISNELDYIINDLRPAQIRMRDLSLSAINAAMKSSAEIKLQYTSKQARIANAWKKWIGQIDGLKRGAAVQVKKDAEKRYIDAANTDDKWKEEYAKVVPALNEIADNTKEYDFAYKMFNEYYYYGSEAFKLSRKMNEIIKEYEMDSLTKIELIEEMKELRPSIEKFYENYNTTVDRQILALQSDYYKEKITNENFVPASLQENTGEALSNLIFENSFFTSEERYTTFLDKFHPVKSFKILEKDPLLKLTRELEAIFNDQLLNPLRMFYGQKNQLMKQYVKGKYEMFPDDKHWSDANSTLRITYGKLEGSVPRDGMKYTPYTTMDGLIEKYNTDNPDYDLLPRMLELWEKKEYGGYDQDGELWICFTGSNHTTGGNSGSPVIDAEGNLMGLNFDRSWESTMSDYMFDASRCRNITVDIRYVLWVIDVYGEAGHLIEEMTLVK
jgi:hypothetical protein